ncbi:MAG: type IV conjugative transfer system protein TraL [Proteobacteria bacterium]|nr:type IV conjugative transfer system protein TraL [Pseudomonadota bacterium]
MADKVPQYLSSPLQIYIFEADEVGIISGILGWAMIFGGWIAWISLVVVPLVYRKAKLKYPKGFIKHLSYYIGIKDMKPYPGPYEKEFQE